MLHTAIPDFGCYKIVQGIKIYEGVTQSIKNDTLDRIKHINKDFIPLLHELVPSTLTAKGKFTNVQFHEKKLIKDIYIPEDSNLLKIGCNYGEIFNPRPPYKEEKKKKNKSNRGRKPKKKISTRKKQGTGDYFSSQIQACVYNIKLIRKILKIKIFRNGVFQAPGVYDPEMIDLIEPVLDLRKWLRDMFKDDSIDVKYFSTVMRNYKCKLLNEKTRILIINLREAILDEKKSERYKTKAHKIIDSVIQHPLSISNIISEYIDPNYMGIAEVEYNSERYFGLNVKFRRPVPWDMDNKATIKILKSGKINFDGCCSEIEATELYHILSIRFVDHNSICHFNDSSFDSL